MSQLELGKITIPAWEWCVGGNYSVTFRTVAGPHWLGRILQRLLLLKESEAGNLPRRTVLAVPEASTRP